MTGGDVFMGIMGLVVFGIVYLKLRAAWREGRENGRAWVAKRDAARLQQALDFDAAYLDELERIRRNRNQEQQP